MHENPLISVAFLSADDPLRAYIGGRYLTRYKKPVSGRLGMPGLERLVTEATGQRPGPDTAYLFITKGNKAAKILIRDAVSTNMLELHDGNGRLRGDFCAGVLRFSEDAKKLNRWDVRVSLSSRVFVSYAGDPCRPPIGVQMSPVVGMTFWGKYGEGQNP